MRGRQALARLEDVRAIMRRFPLLRPLVRDRAWCLGLLDGIRHHPRAGGRQTLRGSEAQRVERGLIQDARDGETIVVLIGAHRGVRLRPPHPVDAAGIVSGGFKPFLGAFDLLRGGPALLRGE